MMIKEPRESWKAKIINIFITGGIMATSGKNEIFAYVSFFNYARYAKSMLCLYKDTKNAEACE